MYYEVIYESGLNSVMQADSDEEVSEALKEQHERAMRGQPGGPSGDRAERVVKVLKYDYHPNDYNVGQQAPTKDVTATLNKLADSDGLVDLTLAVTALREMSDPMVASDVHESNYKMKETGELELAWL